MRYECVQFVEYLFKQGQQKVGFEEEFAIVMMLPSESNGGWFGVGELIDERIGQS